jgi:hypothetical protein
MSPDRFISLIEGRPPSGKLYSYISAGEISHFSKLYLSRNGDWVGLNIGWEEDLEHLDAAAEMMGSIGGCWLDIKKNFDKLGFIRVCIEDGQLMFDGKPNYRQQAELHDAALENGLRLIDDEGNEITESRLIEGITEWDKWNCWIGPFGEIINARHDHDSAIRRYFNDQRTSQWDMAHLDSISQAFDLGWLRINFDSPGKIIVDGGVKPPRPNPKQDGILRDMAIEKECTR